MKKEIDYCRPELESANPAPGKAPRSAGLRFPGRKATPIEGDFFSNIVPPARAVVPLYNNSDLVLKPQDLGVRNNEAE